MDFSSTVRGFCCVFSILFVGAQAQAQNASDEEIARALAQMLQAARGVIGAHQDHINSAEPVDKGLTGERVLAEAIEAFVAKGNPEPGSHSDARLVRLLEAQTTAISEVMTEATFSREPPILNRVAISRWRSRSESRKTRTAVARVA